MVRKERYKSLKIRPSFPNVVVVKTKERTCYGDILLQMKTDPNLQKVRANDMKIKCDKNGNLILKLYTLLSH